MLSQPLAPWATSEAKQRLAELTDTHRELSADRVASAVATATASQMHRFGADGLSLYAGSNVLSPKVIAAHETRLATRPALGWPGEKIQPGLEGIEALEVIAAQQLRRAFGAAFAEPRFVTATLANLAAYTALAEPGDTLAVLSPAAGSHASHHSSGTAGVRGLRTVPLPYDAVAGDVDVSQLDDFMAAVRPRVILVGGSVIQFPTNIAPLREAADRWDAKLVFDASHVAGLIAAGVFPNPLAEGVDLMTFSTYKTLAGPAGGGAVSNHAEIAERVTDALYPVLSSNYDPARLGPLAVATAEAVEQQPAWAQRTVELAVAIAERFAARGLRVQGADRGYTMSHQVVVDVSEFGGGVSAMRALEAAGVFVGACRLAADDSAAPPAGMRLGTQEIVRLGASYEHAEPIVELICRILRGGAAALTSSEVENSHERTAEIRRSFGSDLWGRPPE
ncbi:Serine hydroxymethyltransferase [Leucobacter sp. 7(1)]|uniref:beta-eliminating lyase-related protein n=1 Tax=Leucobacter sp. 7(1) TaxID=1255613 RepID=UPI00097ECEFC|nr:beta-eliminating lyase-related protein [Leucobacter sp. 7(1)]SJN09957.1 Serine hydroxymethyltransferase [Leucobacter sp. 7(1)]